VDRTVRSPTSIPWPSTAELQFEERFVTVGWAGNPSMKRRLKTMDFVSEEFPRSTRLVSSDADRSSCLATLS
jgi:hypothetical protein